MQNPSIDDRAPFVTTRPGARLESGPHQWRAGGKTWHVGYVYQVWRGAVSWENEALWACAHKHSSSEEATLCANGEVMGRLRGRDDYCQCARWRRFAHIPSEHATFEARAELLTPRRWKREHASNNLPEQKGTTHMDTRDPTVKFFKDRLAGTFAISTTASDPGAFLRSVAIELPHVLAGFSGDEEFILEWVLPQICALWAKLNGYKADSVFEERLLTVGHPRPEAHMTYLNAEPRESIACVSCSRTPRPDEVFSHRDGEAWCSDCMNKTGSLEHLAATLPEQ